MEKFVQKLTLAIGLAVFAGLPLLLYALGDAPVRSVLKEVLSLVTLLCFTSMLGQFFLARSNTKLFEVFKAPAVQKVHKYFAYGAITIIALHPFFIVLPRYFEAGVKPWDAFWTMITQFDSLGVVLGLIAWVAMITLGVSAYYRMKLVKRFTKRYRGWRGFHAILAVSFTIAAIWHAIELGRHTDLAMSFFFIALILAGVVMLGRLYMPLRQKEAVPDTLSLSEGAQS